MIWWIWFLMILDACIGLHPQATVDVSTVVDWEPVSVNGIEGVIVSERDAHQLVSPSYPDVTDNGYWTPTLTHIEAAEAAILADQGELLHLRQYAGFIEHGDRKILVNGFCDSFGGDWRHAPVLVDDGGDCFFTAVYNADLGALEMFRFNGQA